MSIWKKTWNFIWKSDSVLSWIVNVVLAFLLVKFIIYPGLGLILNTGLPVVAVVSSSMEHNGVEFDEWWEINKGFYLDKGITKEMFESYSFMNGFNKGDIVFLYGTDNLEKGDVIVYDDGSHRYPIIHRVVDKDINYVTKGDNNQLVDKAEILEANVIGKGIFRIPWLGWVKIMFNNLVGVAT